MPVEGRQLVPPGETALGRTVKVVAFSAVVEAATGLALMAAPAFVIGLLLGPAVSEAMLPLGRIAGIALLALGIACLPRSRSGAATLSAYRALLVYNGLVAAYLSYLGAAGAGGRLLWPAVVLHAGVAILLLWAARAASRAA